MPLETLRTVLDGVFVTKRGVQYVKLQYYRLLFVGCSSDVRPMFVRKSVLRGRGTAIVQPNALKRTDVVVTTERQFLAQTGSTDPAPGRSPFPRGILAEGPRRQESASPPKTRS